MKAAVTILLVLWLALLPAAQAANSPAPQGPKQSTLPENIGNTVPPVPTAGMSREEALRADLARMRAILYQMQNNLAFVQTTQGPLKHQFELEVEMWQALLQHMEHTIAAEPSTTAPAHH